GQRPHAFGEAGDAIGLELHEGFFPRGIQDDVDLALVAGIYAALNERALAALQSADDARHLRGQDAQEALDVADDHGAVGLEDGEGEELDLLEVAGAAAATERRQTEAGEHVEEVLGDVFEALAGAGSHGRLP